MRTFSFCFGVTLSNPSLTSVVPGPACVSTASFFLPAHHVLGLWPESICPSETSVCPCPCSPACIPFPPGGALQALPLSLSQPSCHCPCSQHLSALCYLLAFPLSASLSLGTQFSVASSRKALWVLCSLMSGSVLSCSLLLWCFVPAAVNALVAGY